MALEFDTKMLFYLGIIVVGIFIIPIESHPAIYLVAGIALTIIGIILVIIKVKK
jgi:hypothetical protein